MLKTITLVAIAALTLAACGDSDSAETAEPTETTEVEEVSETTGSSEASGDCNLTEEQINDDTMVVLGSYLIEGDTLLCSPTEEAAETFAIYTDLIPADYRQGVIGFVAIDQESSDGTDGAMQDVYGPDGEPTGDRYLALDVTGSSVELERTIVHEVGHTIFVDALTDEATSFGVEFNKKFAPGHSFEDAPEEFVSEYAASVPDGGEDIAESWAMFVFDGTEFAGDADDDGELDAVEPGTIAADKVAFFEDYPDLVGLRDTIRANAGV